MMRNFLSSWPYKLPARTQPNVFFITSVHFDIGRPILVWWPLSSWKGDKVETNNDWNFYCGRTLTTFMRSSDIHSFPNGALQHWWNAWFAGHWKIRAEIWAWLAENFSSDAERTYWRVGLRPRIQILSLGGKLDVFLWSFISPLSSHIPSMLLSWQSGGDWWADNWRRRTTKWNPRTERNWDICRWDQSDQSAKAISNRRDWGIKAKGEWDTKYFYQWKPKGVVSVSLK